MKMVHFCCVKGCNNKHGRGDFKFYNFPTDDELKKLWIQILRINRQVSKHMRVCSAHFTNADFIELPGYTYKRRSLKKGVIPSQNLPKDSSHQSSETSTSSIGNEGDLEESTEITPLVTEDSSGNQRSCPTCKKDHEYSSVVCGAAQGLCNLRSNKTADQTEKEKQLESALLEIYNLQCQNATLELEKTEIQNELSCSEEKCMSLNEKQNQLAVAHQQLEIRFGLMEKSHDQLCIRNRQLEDEILQLRERVFSINSFRNCDKKFRYWTGLKDYASFKILLSFLVPRGNVSCINYDSVSPDYLPLEEQLFFVLCKLKHNLEIEDLAYRYGKSSAGMCRLFKTWMNYMHLRLGSLSKWPDQDAPAEFLAEYSNTLANTDGTELGGETVAEGGVCDIASPGSFNDMDCIQPFLKHLGTKITENSKQL